jgi:hypothetical protein
MAAGGVEEIIRLIDRVQIDKHCWVEEGWVGVWECTPQGLVECVLFGLEGRTRTLCPPVTIYIAQKGGGVHVWTGMGRLEGAGVSPSHTWTGREMDDRLGLMHLGACR